MLRILVIEDESKLRKLLIQAIQGEGYQVEGAGTGEEGLLCHRRNPAHLIVLDLMLPGADGYQVLDALRAEDEVPVILLTALGFEANRLRGFNAGADDYLVKPVSLLELFARIKAILKRARYLKAETLLASGPFLLDGTKKLLTRHGAPVGLSPTEFNLLQVLMTRVGQPLTRSELVNLAWSSDARPAPRTVDVHITNMRKKLSQPGDPAWIQNMASLGYSWAEPILNLSPPEEA